MKEKKPIQPLFIGVVASLLIVLGIIIGIAMSKDNGNTNDSESIHTEESGNTSEGITEESESMEDGNATESTENTQSTEESESEEDTQETEQQVVVPSKPSKDRNTDTFVLLSVDASQERSDSIMVVHVNHDTKSVKVASLLRDCMVKIKGHDFEKLNRANVYGGPSLALDTINTNFDLDISNYMLINFENLVEVVDKIGGIEHQITAEECQYMGDARFESAGKYTLSGKDVLAYSRIRKAAGGDRKRTERQREMFFKIFEKSKKLPAVERVELLDEMIEKIDSNYRRSKVVDLMYYLSQYKITDMDAFPLVYYDGLVGDLWYEVPITLVDMNAALHEFLFGTTNYVPSKTVKEYSEILKGKVSGPNADFRN